jgi:hypothetical protein
MIKKEEALVEIKARIKTVKVSLGLVTFVRTPTVPVDIPEMPAVFMIEGVDHINKYSSRSSIGYPAKRIAEVVVELITAEKDSDGNYVDIKSMYRTVRSAIMINANPLLKEDGSVDPTVFIREARTEGPSGYGLPDVVGMRLVLELFYIDKG